MYFLFDERNHPVIIKNLEKDKYLIKIILILNIVTLVVFFYLFIHSTISISILVLVVIMVSIISGIELSSSKFIPLLTPDGVIILKKRIGCSNFKEVYRIRYANIKSVMYLRQRTNDYGLIMLVYSRDHATRSVFFRIGKEVIDCEKFMQILSQQNVNIISDFFPFSTLSSKESQLKDSKRV